MLMPKTAMNEECYFVFSKDKIGASGEITSLKAKT
jgi:hypothetical protein